MIAAHRATATARLSAPSDLLHPMDCKKFMRTKTTTSTNRSDVLIFDSARRRKSGAKLRLLEQTYLNAVQEQVRIATRLEELLGELERASGHAEDAAWALSSARQCRTSCMSFGEIMGWVAEVCRVRSAGEHFCIAETVRASSALEPREPVY
jgi:hypothetical protein